MASGRHSREFWKRLFVEVEAKRSVVEVACRHGVNQRTLHWWCWKLRGEQRNSAMVEDAPRMLPVLVRDVAPVSSVGAEVVVEWNDVRVRVTTGVDVEYVAALLGAVRRAC